MNVGDATVLRILDRDDRLARSTILHRVECILEAEAGKGQRIWARFGSGTVGVRPGRSLEGDRARASIAGIVRETLDEMKTAAAKVVDDGEGGAWETAHHCPRC